MSDAGMPAYFLGSQNRQSSMHENPRYNDGQMLKRRLMAFAAAIMAAICILVADAISEEKQAAYDHAWTNSTNLSAGFEEGVRAIFDDIAKASSFLKDEIEAEAARGGTFDLAGWRRKVLELVSPTVNVTIIGADGNLRETTVPDAKPVSHADRDFFSAHRDNPNLGLFIGKPAYGVIKRMIIPVTRRLNTPDGRFAGVVEFSLDPGLLSGLYRKVDLGKTGLLDLFFNDGTVFARYTSERGLNASLVGFKMKGLQTLAEAEHAESGRLTGRASLMAQGAFTLGGRWRASP